MRFINRYTDTWPAVINLISSGKLNVDKFVTHRFPLTEAKEALNAVVDPHTPTIKVMIIDDVDF